jgi:hypothetical protein
MGIFMFQIEHINKILLYGYIYVPNRTYKQNTAIPVNSNGISQYDGGETKLVFL